MVFGLLLLDRHEVAASLANELVAIGEDVGASFMLHSQQGQFEGMIEFVETRRPSIAEHQNSERAQLGLEPLSA